MIANPGKFKVILFQKNKRNTSEYPIVLTGLEIKMQEPVTLLGISIDYKLFIEKHISKLCQKASAQLNTLKRFGAFMSQNYDVIIYLSALQLLPFSLMLYICETNYKNEKKIQERASRFITDDYSSSYEKHPNDSNTSTVTIKRVHSLCTEKPEQFKCALYETSIP